MSDTNPKTITEREWQEILELEDVASLWGLDDDSAEERLEYARSNIYGVKFDFQSGSPGYVGDLFLLQGEALNGHPPVTIIRNRDKRLRLVN